MLAGALTSFIYFKPEELAETFTPPNVEFTGFKIFDREYRIDSLLDSSKAIHIGYSDNFITIQFASTYYTSPKKIHYYYQLTGVDKNWVNAGNFHSAAYTNLSDGSYTFQVKCVNDDGYACAKISTLNIIIATPFFKSWWFISLSVLIACAFAYGAYAYRKNNRRQFSKIRSGIASDLHDDIGSTLNSISVYSELADRQLNSDAGNVKNLLHIMGNASRDMIIAMNDIVWAINPQNDNFENILQRMQYFAGGVLSGKNIVFDFFVDDKAKKIQLPMQKRKNFYLVYKEAINNAYKYADCKKVSVQIYLQQKNLVMTIVDDGKGFDISAGRTGNGLNNITNRAAEAGATVKIESGPLKGASIKFTMPVK
jgi:signal transduction histidine kinase